MKIDLVSEIFEIIVKSKTNPSNKLTRAAREKVLNSNGIVKVAFDTRRINQEITYNPRRGLQNYHRSDPFISEDLGIKIKAFSKLSLILNEIRSQYEREPLWQDSYCRVLASAVEKGLRKNEGDNDYSDMQPSMASLNYLEELIDVRYRLTIDAINNLSDKDIMKIILSKDEMMVNSGFYTVSSDPPKTNETIIIKDNRDLMLDKLLLSMANMQKKQDDDLMTKLFGVKASKENPEIERTVTISIKDKLVSESEKIIEKTAEEEKTQ